MKEKIEPINLVTFVYSQCPLCHTIRLNRVVAKIDGKALLVRCKTCEQIFKIKTKGGKNEESL